MQGIIDKLAHIQELGFNGIYLSPVFDAYSNHKFDTIDYYEIDPAFGTKEKFKELIEAIHQRGMKVMLDITCDHLSDFRFNGKMCVNMGRGRVLLNGF